MKNIIRSIYKNPLKNAIYIVLLITIFTPITLLLNTFFMGQRIILRIQIFRESFADYEFLKENEWFFNIQKLIQSHMSSLLGTSVLLVLMCILVLPFLQYMLSLGRGYEIGVLRALGLGKGKAWIKLLLENILLICSALILSLCFTLALHKIFAFSLLGIDTQAEKFLTEKFTAALFVFNIQAFFYTLIAAGAVTIISSLFSNILISNSAPLKLIIKHK